MTKIDPVVLTTRPNETLASLLISALREEGIECQMAGMYTSGMRAEAPGQIQILVHSGDLERAKAVLEAFEGEEDTGGEG